MDGRGRLAQPLTWIARLRARPPTGGASPRAASRVRSPTAADAAVRACSGSCSAAGSGIAAHAAAARRRRRGRGRSIMLAGLGYGVVKGEHVPAIVEALEGCARPGRQRGRLPHRVARAHRPPQSSREEVLAIAGVTGRTSLLFLDVERRASGSRPIPGSPTRPCSSSIPASCRSASRSASRSRSGRRTAASR